MPVSVQMPQLGESVTEGTVTRWLKKEGERVEADEPLLEVSTDKVDTEIPSPSAGILVKIVVAEDETVEVGSELAIIDENAQAGAPAPAAETPAPAPAQAPVSSIPQPAPAAAPAPAVAAAPAAAPVAAAPAAVEAVEVDTTLRGRTEKMTRLRQTMSKRLVESLQTAAQLTTVVEVDVTKIARLREKAKADFLRRERVKLSFMPFFELAAVEALKQHPKLNATINNETMEVTYFDVEHLALAVDTERGLIAAVIKNAGDLNLAGLARKTADLAERTRANKVTPDEITGGTFTLTNTGSRGALFDTPILNQPQVGMLGTGAVVKRAVVMDTPEGEVIAIRSMVYLALTYDHRLVDGADAARFLTTMKRRLEEGRFEAQLGLE